MSTTTQAGRIAIIALVITGNILTGCAQNYATPQQAAASACSSLGPRALSGALIGALAGAGAGAAVGAAAGNGKDAAYGALAGLLVGSLIGLAKGKELDKRDCATAQAALQGVGETKVGDSITWSTPETGSHGVFKPVSEVYTSNAGQPCRRIQADYYMKDHQAVEGDSGIVCRTPDGDWVRQPINKQNEPM